MKKLFATFAAALTLLAFTGIASAAPALPTAGQCAGFPTKSVKYGDGVKLTVSNTNVVIAGGAGVKVTGNGNCITSTNGGDGLKVIGNNNYVSDARADVKLTGTNNFFQSGGGNSVNCGGSAAVVNKRLDAYHDCVLQ